MNTHDAVVRRFLVVAVAIPVVVVAVSVALQLTWWGELPDQVATHWNAAGEPDAFGSASTMLISTVVLGLLMPAATVAVTLPSLRRGVRGIIFRFLGAFSAWMAVFGAVLSLLLTEQQRGIADGAHAPNPGVAILAALGAGLIVGLCAWLYQPHQEGAAPHTFTATDTVLSGEQRGAWVSTAAMSKNFKLVLLANALALAAVAVLVWVTSGMATGLIIVGAMVLLIVVTSAMVAFTVRIDARGVSVVSAVGFPRLHVPLSEIESVGTTTVNSLADFGGFGIRMVPGGTGVVLRNGEALQVVRTTGRRFVVTMDNAETAAALLNTYVQRAAHA